MLVVVVVLVLLLVAVDVFADGPLRRHIEQEMNARLEGYHVDLSSVDFSPWNLSLELRGLAVVQEAHPEPAVAAFPRIAFSVQWLGLLRGHVVGDVLLEAPALHIDLEKLREERHDEIELDERGWQDALLAAYPLKVNRLDVERGALTYTHGEGSHPLEIDQIEMVARNIRNIRSDEEVYPSPVSAIGRVFEHGRVELVGNADFLEKPHAGLRTRLRLENVPLERLDPVGRDLRLVISGGRLSAEGELEVSPDKRDVLLETVRIDGLHADYVFDPVETEQALELAKQIERDPAISYRIETLLAADGELGFVNRTVDPGYRLFLSDARLIVEGLASRSEQVSQARLEGLFMGSGETVASGVFRPDRDGADFEVAVAIRGTELSALNDLLRTYAKLDVTAGRFSFYSELEVAEGQLDGYIKPLFEDVDIYDPEQDRHKGFFKRVWEGIAEGLTEILANRPRDEVATLADLEGSVENPDASNWQILYNVVRNAFFEAILPGFQRHVS